MFPLTHKNALYLSCFVSFSIWPRYGFLIVNRKRIIIDLRWLRSRRDYDITSARWNFEPSNRWYKDQGKKQYVIVNGHNVNHPNCGQLRGDKMTTKELVFCREQRRGAPASLIFPPQRNRQPQVYIYLWKRRRHASWEDSMHYSY